MKKPTAVKIVEALGWAYVALAALAGMAMGYEVVRFGCGASAVVESVFYLLVLLALPLGMVLSLRNGRRVWFLCSHWAAVGLFLCIAIFIAVVMFPKAWIFAGTAFVLLVVPIVLLLRPESSLWCRHVSNGKDPGGGGCLISALTLLWIVLLALLSSDMSCRIKSAVAQASNEQACAAEQDADDAELPPDDGEAPPDMDANYVAREGAVYKVRRGMRNLPTTMPSGFRPPDHSSLTNNEAGVSVDI